MAGSGRYDTVVAKRHSDFRWSNIISMCSRVSNCKESGLGTGLGSALIVDAYLEPLELAQLPYKNHRSFEQLVGVAALRRLGKKRWTKNVFDMALHKKSDTTCFSSVESQLGARWQLWSDG